MPLVVSASLMQQASITQGVHVVVGGVLADVLLGVGVLLLGSVVAYIYIYIYIYVYTHTYIHNIYIYIYVLLLLLLGSISPRMLTSFDRT